MQTEYAPSRQPVLFRVVKMLWIFVTSIFFLYALLVYLTGGKILPGSLSEKGGLLCGYTGSGVVRDTISFNQGGIKVANDLKVALEEQYAQGCKDAIRFETAPGTFMGILNAACLMQAKEEMQKLGTPTGKVLSGSQRK